MSNPNAAVAKGLFEEFAAQLATVFETMAGTRPAIACVDAAAPSVSDSLCWKQPLPPLHGAAHIVAEQEHWTTVGQRLLAAAGVDDASEDDIRSTYLETIGQALGGLAAHLTGLLRREVASSGGNIVTGSTWTPSTMWCSLRIGAGTNPMVITFGLDLAIIEAVLTAREPQATSQVQEPEEQMHGGITESDARTFDLLLDVELPVSVSFGRAHVPLKDVLKLTTGSIVELNRAVVEPVDIIVNNCVIARGEVVVVEGNFGVRIQQVVSRSERLRTIQ